jgi:hypothetical protein
MLGRDTLQSQTSHWSIPKSNASTNPTGILRGELGIKLGEKVEDITFITAFLNSLTIGNEQNICKNGEE